MKKMLLASIFSLLLIGCGEDITNDQYVDATPTESEEIESSKNVVVSFYPLAFITKQIVGDTAQVINLAENAEVHDYELSPQDMVKLNNADLVIYQGAMLEPWVNDVIPALKAKNISVLEVSHDIELTKHEPDDEHHKTADHDDDEHNHGAFDPHTWLDPVLAQKMVDEILKSLIVIDSANQATYQANAESLKAQFTLLDQSFQTTLQNCALDEVITSHDAFGYIARRYGFHAHSIAGISTHDEPSAQLLANLKKEAIEEGMKHLLVEENTVKRFAETLVNETGLQVLPLNPLERGTLDPSKTFFQVAEENLQSFKTALQCP